VCAGIPAELFGGRAESATAPVQGVVGRFRTGRVVDGAGRPAVVGNRRWRQRSADAAAAPFANVVDGGRGRTVDGEIRRRDASRATAAAGDGRLRDGRQDVAARAAAAVARAAQAQEIVRRDQERRVRRVFHRTAFVQLQPSHAVGPRTEQQQQVVTSVQAGPRLQHVGTVAAAPAPVARPRTRVRRRGRRWWRRRRRTTVDDRPALVVTGRRPGQSVVLGRRDRNDEVAAAAVPAAAAQEQVEGGRRNARTAPAPQHRLGRGSFFRSARSICNVV